MKAKYKITPNKDYYIQELNCKCNLCNMEFIDYIPLNYELICFVDINNKKYFLPTYGNNGYLDLLEKSIYNWDKSKPITKNISDKFIELLNIITNYNVILFDKTKCPKCNSSNVYIYKRVTKKNYPVNWMEINIEELSAFK